jgi:chemotaxis signal transduction protein
MAITAESKARQYLTFKLGEEMFALDIAKVREVLDVTAVTKVPLTPDFMRGVINLRGSVIPVVDLRVKFGRIGDDREHLYHHLGSDRGQRHHSARRPGRLGAGGAGP